MNLLSHGVCNSVYSFRKPPVGTGVFRQGVLSAETTCNRLHPTNIGFRPTIVSDPDDCSKDTQSREQKNAGSKCSYGSGDVCFFISSNQSCCLSF